jgi:ABC-type phosphate transport system substrate-binding protein
MNKTLATVALAAIPALLLSACNGNSASGTPGVAALPNAPASQAQTAGQRVHRNDTGPQDLHAGGATFPAYAYNLASQPVGNYSDPQPGPGAGSLFNKAPTTGTVYYCLTGSGDGRKAFEGSGDSGFPPTGPCAPLGAAPTGFGGRQDPLDFAGSDVAMSSADYNLYKPVREPASGTNWGEPFEFPTIGGPIIYGFRTGDFSGSVKLSAWSYCAIANGTISDWNDPALTADNGSSLTGGVSQPITFYFRADSSGTSFLYTNHLNTACNVTWTKPYNKAPYQSAGHSAAWTFGVNSTWPGPGSSAHPNPNFIGEQGNPGVLASIQTTAFSTGYVEGAYAKSVGLGQAHLQNGFANGAPIFVDPQNRTAVVNALKKVTSANITYGEGSDEVPLGTSRPDCILYVDPSHFVTPPVKTYPIVGFSYWLFYGNNNGVHVSDKKKLINFLVSAKASTITNKLEYASLSSSIHTAITNALGGSSPCLK